jgi:hypothetical protein
MEVKGRYMALLVRQGWMRAISDRPPEGIKALDLVVFSNATYISLIIR